MKLKAVIASTIVTFGAFGTMTTFAATDAGSTVDVSPTTERAMVVGQMDDIEKMLGIDEKTLQSDFAQGQSLVQIAAAKGMSEQTLIANIEASQKARLDAAVQNGQLTAAEAQQMQTDMDEHDKQLVEHKGGFHRKHRHHFHGLQDAAAVLGMDEATLKSQLNSGKSILQLAQQKGMSQQQLVSALTARLKTRLDQAVKAGKLSSDKEAKILKRYQAHLDKFINHKGGFHHGKNAKHSLSTAAN
ncbi:hypothetical protein [Alicyclobacillus fodiniaquatilis]|uniref:LysM domain-containing protein n=1 Tax=Alicyclobacillus fodiniaquatilis TaxID=1661150 RepID=A0ABW4JAR2_9BACL